MGEVVIFTRCRIYAGSQKTRQIAPSGMITVVFNISFLFFTILSTILYTLF